MSIHQSGMCGTAGFFQLVIDALDQDEASGWNRLEAAKALAEVANGIHMGERGTDPNE